MYPKIVLAVGAPASPGVAFPGGRPGAWCVSTKQSHTGGHVRPSSGRRREVNRGGILLAELRALPRGAQVAEVRHAIQGSGRCREVLDRSGLDTDLKRELKKCDKTQSPARGFSRAASSNSLEGRCSEASSARIPAVPSVSLRSRRPRRFPYDSAAVIAAGRGRGPSPMRCRPRKQGFG